MDMYLYFYNTIRPPEFGSEELYTDNFNKFILNVYQIFSPPQPSNGEDIIELSVASQKIVIQLISTYHPIRPPEVTVPFSLTTRVIKNYETIMKINVDLLSVIFYYHSTRPPEESLLRPCIEKMITINGKNDSHLSFHVERSAENIIRLLLYPAATTVTVIFIAGIVRDWGKGLRGEEEGTTLGIQ